MTESSKKSEVKNETVTEIYQTYSDGMKSAINDKSRIRWKTFFLSIPFGLFTWLFGLLGWNSLPQVYVENNCSYEFIKGYKSKKKALKFLPSFISWLTVSNVFYFILYYMIIA